MSREDAEAARLRFGVVTRAAPRDARRPEDLGFGSLWWGGHIASPNGSPEVMTQLARLSALAERAIIGTSIVPLPLYPPAGAGARHFIIAPASRTRALDIAETVSREIAPSIVTH